MAMCQHCGQGAIARDATGPVCPDCFDAGYFDPNPKGKVRLREDTDVQAEMRKDDGAIVIHTTAYVTHKKARTPWPSSFSMNRAEAEYLRDRLNEILSPKGQPQ